MKTIRTDVRTKKVLVLAAAPCNDMVKPYFVSAYKSGEPIDDYSQNRHKCVDCKAENSHLPMEPTCLQPD